MQQSTSSPLFYQRTSSSLDATHTETTRYLCAASHLDEAFRRYLMKQIVEEEHRAVGELYGVDIVPIVKWCFVAQQRTLVRDIILFILLFVAIIVDIQHIFTPAFYSYGYYGYVYQVPFWVFLVFTPILLMVVSLLGLIPSLILTILLLPYELISFPTFLLFFLAAWLIVLVETAISYYGPEAKQLTKNRFRADSVQFTLDPNLEQKLRALSSVQSSNVVVYSGYSPFVGAGIDLGGWSFPVDMSKGKRENGVTLTPIPFQVGELYSQITTAIAQLGLNNLVVEDKLYVNGQEIRDDQRFLAQPFTRPYTMINPAIVHQFMESPSQDIRYYKCIRVTSWKGELVLSIFVRFVKIGKNLFLEADYQLLPPLKEVYYQIDTNEPTLTMRKFGALAARSFLPTLGTWFRSPARLVSAMFHNWSLMREHKRTERQIRGNPAFDYGAVSSLREAASSTNYRRYFQKLDKEMYVKIIQSQLFDSIISFLDGKNIDTSDLKERQETILNNGVIVSGGTFQAGNVAVGDQARATLANFTGAIRGALQGNGATAGTTQQTSRH